MREGQAKVLSSTEVKRLYAVAGSGRHATRNTVLLDFSFKLGLRVKEMAALKIDDVVDEKGNVLDSFELKVGQRKGGRGREIYLSNRKLREKLEAYLEERSGDSNRRLFKSQKTVFTANTMQQLLKRLYTAAGIKGAKSHSGRRTFATRLIEAGYDIKAVSMLMGHSSVQTTARYVSDKPVRLSEMVANL